MSKQFIHLQNVCPWSDLDNLFNTYYHGMKVLGTASISDVDKRKYESKLQEIGISPKKFIDE